MSKYAIYTLLVSMLILSFIPAAIADEDNYFSIRENYGPYETVPGEGFVIKFLLSNRDLLHPREVTVSVENCPEAWECESKTLSYEDKGYHPENLTVSVPPEALPKRYTLYIGLESEYWTQKGDNRVVVSVLSEQQAKAISYEEYLARRAAEDAPSAVMDSGIVAGSEEASEPDVPARDMSDRYTKGLVDEETEPLAEEAAEPTEPAPAASEDSGKEDGSFTEEVGEAVERLESDSQFVEFLSIVLIVLLVFILAGAYAAHRKKE
ncbi:hypothetical protein KY362_05235 [Candidatus Woesearchaeota archaeon]|nr:hypothetical protein [Candidatus Woesearchaeota archaeon]